MPPFTRTASSSSQWVIPGPADGDEEEIRDQRRLRHLSAVLIRNLTLNPRRDQLSSLLHAPAPPAATGPARTQDDTDLLLRSVQKRRSRASSSASMGSFGSSGARAVPQEWRAGGNGRDDEPGSGSQTPVAGGGGDANSTRSKTRPRRASAASTLIREETEPPSPTSAPSPLAGPSSPSFERTIDLYVPTSPSMRKRSASRASATSALSAGTSTSNTTIRQSTSRLDHDEESGSFSPQRFTPKLPLPLTPGPRTFHAAGSEAQLAKEKARRADILRRRLVDSFVSLELAPSSSSSFDVEQSRTDRRRAPTVGGGASLRGRMIRSDSASSSLSLGGGEKVGGWTSPKKRPTRNRTYSSPVAPSASSFASTSTSTSTTPPSPTPFFVSSPAHETMHPNFVVDRDGFTLPSSSGAPTEPGLDEESALEQWEGLRESRVIVKVWTRGGELEGKGKGKERAEEEAEWKLLVEWDVEMDGLVSLGRDPTAFPPLPPNTLVFHLSSSDEYYTAPLPSRRQPRAHSNRHGHRSGLGSLSDGDAEEDDESDASCCSSEESGDEGGNQSDPGAGGTVSFRSRKAASLIRRRAESSAGKKQSQEDREAEEARKRKALVEKSVRETRMVRAATGSEVSRLVALEHDLTSTRRSIFDLKRTLSTALCGEGADQGLEGLERERNEVKDRVEDLESVKEDMKDDLGEARRDLKARREALRRRRDRLKAAEELTRTRRGELDSLRKDIVDDESTCADIRRVSQTRRTQVITLLSHIFPVDPYTPKSSSASSSATAPLLFSILSLPLPNSSYSPSALASETISSALGYTAQVVSTLAAYLGVPVHYPIKCLGSRSAVVDLISMMRGPRAFPLYPKGVDRYRFDYAVFLLNKNIEQLMYSQGLTVIDLRNTLPNLKSLILALSYDPSHSNFSASTVAAPPPLFDIGSSPAVEASSPTTSPEGVNPATSTTPEATRSVDEASNEAEEGDLPPQSPTSTLKPPSIRSSSPAPTVSSLRSNATINGSTQNGRASDAAPSPPSKDTAPAKARTKTKSRPAEKIKVKLSSSPTPPMKPKLNGRETMVAEEAKEALLRGAKDAGVGSGKGEGSARKSSGSRLASTLWSAVGYAET